MKIRTLVKSILLIPLFIGAVVFLLSYLYAMSENNNFEANRKKSLLNCEQLPLHCLIREGDEAGINAYVQSKANIELKDGWGRSALFWAIKKEKLEYVDILLAAGADPNARDEQGKRVLLVAITSGFTKVADKLITYGADVNGLTDIYSKQGLLHYCVHRNGERCVVYLLENGADITIKDGYGFTVIERVEMNNSISDNIRTLIRGAAKAQIAPNVDE